MSGSRRQQAEERREQILDAAVRVFAEKGYGGASVRDIAREVGVTEGLLYHYFDSKEQLMHTCWKERTWHAHLERILGGSERRPLVDVLHDITADFLQTLHECGSSVRMSVSEMQRDPQMAAFYQERIVAIQTLIAEYLCVRQQQGDIRASADLPSIASILLGTAFSVFLLWGREEPALWHSRVEGFVRTVVDVVVAGIVPAEACGTGSRAA